VQSFLFIAQILISLGVIALAPRLEQGDGVARTRRGVERTIFNLTIAFVALFLIISIITVVVQV
jgi:hypothetical protein